MRTEGSAVLGVLGPVHPVRRPAGKPLIRVARRAGFREGPADVRLGRWDWIGDSDEWIGDSDKQRDQPAYRLAVEHASRAQELACAILERSRSMEEGIRNDGVFV